MLVFTLSEGRNCTVTMLRTESAGEMLNERKAHTLVNFHSRNWEYEKPVLPWINYRCQISVLRFWRAGASFVSCLDERDLIYGTKSGSGWKVSVHISPLLTVTSMTDIINCLRCPVALKKQAGFPNHEIWNPCAIPQLGTAPSCALHHKWYKAVVSHSLIGDRMFSHSRRVCMCMLSRLVTSDSLLSYEL